MSAPTVDSPVSSGDPIFATPTTITYTSAGNIDLLVLFVIIEDATAVVSSVSSSHLTPWTKRTAYSSVSYARTVRIEEWIAPASGAVVSEVITPVISSTPDDMAFIAVGVKGVNNSSPFDGNGSFPGTAVDPNSGFQNTTPTIASLTTNSATPLVLAVVADASNVNPGSSPGGGFTFDLHYSSQRGAGVQGGLEHQGYASALSNSSVTWGGSCLGWRMFADAFITGVNPPATFSVTSATAVL